jgi:hypothetical protein
MRRGGDEELIQVTNTHADRGWGGAPAALLLRRARDEMDTALAHIAGAPLSPQVRDQMVQETAALVLRLERLLSLLSREGYPMARPATKPTGS